MKKYISYSIMSIILLALLGLILFLQIPRLKYKYIESLDGYVITNVYGNSKEYDIPTTYNDKYVVGIANKAFEKQTRLEYINFSSDSKISIIEKNAFYNCINLKEITIPSSVVRIETNAFLGCSSLNKVTFNDDSKLKVLEGSVFFDCTNLEIVKLPVDTQYEIGDYCFFNTNIKELIIDDMTRLYPNSLHSVKKESIIKR